MPRGRKPKPTKLKIVTGNPGKRPLDEREPLPKRERPSCPRFLHPLAKAEWKRLVVELDRLGLMTIVDRMPLAVFCQAVAEFELATEALGKDIEGRLTTRGTGGTATHPAVALQRSAWKAIKDFAALFGLDPSSRTRIKTPDVDAPDELAAFLGQRKQQ